jgi:hypothetical protein
MPFLEGSCFTRSIPKVGRNETHRQTHHFQGDKISHQIRKKGGAANNVMTALWQAVNFQRPVRVTDKAAVLHPVAHLSNFLVLKSIYKL